MFVAIDSRNWERLATVLHPNVLFERPGLESLRGVERVVGYYRDERIFSGIHVIQSVIGQKLSHPRGVIRTTP